MPHVPGPGSEPTAAQVRPIQPAEFDCNLARMAPWNVPGQFPLASGAAILSQPFDVLTPLFQGRGRVEAVFGSFTRGLGGPGLLEGPSSEYRVPAVFLDVLCFTRHLISIQFRWIFQWTGIDVATEGASYRWLPVQGGVSPANVPDAHQIQGLRVPSPWFRYELRNEDTAAALNRSDFELFLWLRGG